MPFHLKQFRERLADLRQKSKTAPEAPLDAADLRLFLRDTKGIVSHIQELEREIKDLRIILGTTVDHSTVLENELSEAHTEVLGEAAQYQFIVDSSGDFMALIDHDYRLSAVNVSLCQAFRCSRSDAVGMPLSDLVGEDTYAQVIKSQVDLCFRNQAVHTEFWYHLPLAGRRYLKMSLYPYQESNIVNSVVMVIRDITQRQLVEEQVREQALLLDKAKDAVVVLDMDGNIMYWNPSSERLYGWRKAASMGRHFGRLTYASKGTDLYSTAWQACLQSGEWAGEMAQKGHDGQSVIVDSRWSLVRDGNGAPKSILIINTDVTDRKQLENQFYQVQRLESIGKLASGITHDLNNVLSPFFMVVKSLKMKLKDEKSQRILTLLDTSARRGASLVRQVLTFAKGMEDGRISVQLKYLIQELSTVILETFPKNIEFEFDLPENLWMINGDPTQIHQILLNLCVNSRDALVHGGTMVLSASNVRVSMQDQGQYPDGMSDGAYVHVRLSDTGEGIPEELRDRIFEPFFTTKDSLGTGLGLSTVMSIVQGHNGFISVESTVGGGTTFHLYFPALTSEVVSSVGLEPPDVEPEYGKGEWVLVVDDDPSIRGIAKETLETFGFQVLTASNGQEAVERFRQYSDQIQVILMDVMMPVLDGYKALQEIQEISSSARVVLMSGFDANTKLTKLARGMADQFLDKPFSGEALLCAVNSSLNTAVASA